MFIVSVRDSAVEAFMNPFVVPATGAAVRSFKDEVNRKDAGNAMNKHPDDYELYVLGTFDERTGAIAPCELRVLVRGKDCVISDS